MTRIPRLMMKALVLRLGFLAWVVSGALLLPAISVADEESSVSMEDLYKDLQQTGKNEQVDEIRALQAELLIERNEKKAMQQIQKLLKKYRGTAMEAGLWFRMAELHMRRAKAARFFEMHRQSDTLVSLAPKQVKNASAKNDISSAIQIYDRIERKFPDFRDMDLVLFNSGFARQQVNNNAQARGLYRKLIREYQDSPLLADSYLAIAEMLFDEKKYKEAQSEYEAIKAFPESRVYPYGRYKLAWTLFNLEKNNQALQELEAVVAYSKRLEEQGDARLDLKKEALGDMVLFYSDAKTADKAVNYFVQQAGKEEAGTYILKLMRLYNRHAKWMDERRLFVSLVEELPQENQLPQAYVYMIESLDAQKKREQAVAELETMRRLCDGNSSWVKLAGNSQKNCITMTSGLAANLAVRWHKLWQKNRQAVALAGFAERAYLTHLSFLLPEEKSHLLRYEYANLLYQQEKYRPASEQYFIVAQNITKQPVLHEASYAAIFALQKAVGDRWQKTDEQRYVELANLYLTKNPEAKHREDVEFKRAFIIYDSGRFAEAAPLLADLGEKYKHKPQGIKAQDLYLEILAKNKDFTRIKDYSRKLWAREKSEKRKNLLNKLYQESYFSSIDTMQIEAGNETQRAEAYLAFAKENSQSDLAEKARWNALQIYQKTTALKVSADLAMQFATLHPGSKLRVDALKIATQNYERLTRLRAAAMAAEALVISDPQQSQQWLQLAVSYYRVEGDTKAAARLLVKGENSKDTKLRDWALRNSYEMAIASGDKLAIKNYGAKIDQWQIQPYATERKLTKLDELYREQKWSQAFQLAADILGSKEDSLRPLRAKARFVQALILKKEFLQQSMTSRPDRVAMVLALKTEKLEKAQKAFQSVARYGRADLAMESFIELADLYGGYAASLRAMKLVGVEDKDAGEFYAEMENLALPMLDRQVDTLLEAEKLAKQLGLGSDHLSRITAKLDQLNMRSRLVFEVKLPQPDLQLPDLREVGS